MIAVSRRHLAVLFEVLGQQKSAVVRMAAWSLLEAGPVFLSGRLIACAIDEGFLRQRPMAGVAWLGLLAVSMAVGALGSSRVYLALGTAVEPIRDELVTRLVAGALGSGALGGGTVSNPGSNPGPNASTVAQATQQVEIVRDSVAGMLLGLRYFVFTSVTALLGLLSLAPIMFAAVAPPIVLAMVIVILMLRSLATRQRRVLLADERVATTVATMTEGLRDIAACGAGARVTTALVVDFDRQAEYSVALARRGALRNLTVTLGGLLPVVLVLAITPFLLRDGASAGVIVGTITYLLHGLRPALQTLASTASQTALRLAVAIQRIGETSTGVTSAGVPEQPRPEAPPSFSLASSAELVLDGVTFAYSDMAEPIVRDLDLVIPDGDHLAVVGPSGIGKSTLADLMAGVRRPQAGEVRLAGVPLPAMDLSGLSLARTLIPQETYVFAGTLRENLAWLGLSVTTDDLHRAVAAFGLEPIVERAGGYDTPLDPITLSAGERQLVALARAYLSPARLVILDEACCYLSTPSSKLVPSTPSHGVTAVSWSSHTG